MSILSDRDRWANFIRLVLYLVISESTLQMQIRARNQSEFVYTVLSGQIARLPTSIINLIDNFSNQTETDIYIFTTASVKH